MAKSNPKLRAIKDTARETGSQPDPRLRPGEQSLPKDESDEGLISEVAGNNLSGNRRSSNGEDFAPVLVELMSIGTELAQATEALFRLALEPELSEENFLRQIKELISAYDDYLKLLETQLDLIVESGGQSAGESKWTRQDLLTVYVAADYDRTALTTVIEFMEEEPISQGDAETGTTISRAG